MKTPHVAFDVPVDEFTSRDPYWVSPKDAYGKIVDIMKKHKVRHVPVMEQGRPVGIISERNLKLPSDLGDVIHLHAKDIMVSNPYCTKWNTPLQEVAFQMSKNKIGSALVLDDEDQLLGVFTTTDALNALVDIMRGNL